MMSQEHHREVIKLQNKIVGLETKYSLEENDFYRSKLYYIIHDLEKKKEQILNKY